MRLYKIIILSLFLALAWAHSHGQSSVLSSGRWYKVAIEKNGVYKITYDQLRKMGFDLASTDPRNIRIYGMAGGMLPQPNSTPRPDDLVEHAIMVAGEGDGVFHKQDYILFYAQGADRISYDLSRSVMAYESNLYSEKNFYFITVSGSPGKRIASSENIAGSFPVIQHYQDFVYHETDDHSELKSGREWFGERFDFTTEHSFDFDISGIVENSTIVFVSDVMAQSFNGATFKLYFNNTFVEDQAVTSIPNTQYGLKGRHNRDTLTVNSNDVSAPTNTRQTIKYQYVRSGSGTSTGHLDFFLLSFDRRLALYGDQTIFRTAESVDHLVSQYNIANAKENCLVWDITDAYTPKQQASSFGSGAISFSTNSDVLKEFVVFSTSIPSPELVGEVQNQNLHGMATPALLIVTHPDFLGEAQRLANHRESHDQLSTAIVTVDEVYNEFSSGRQDVTAIRDFVKHLYDKNPSALKTLLLFGRGSYDYKDRVADNTNFVPTYESRNSLAPLETYSSDDYFAFLENDEGNWGEGSPAQNHTLDIGIGRLPVKTAEEAKVVVDKLITYDTNKKNLGRWRKNIVFVADDGSTSDGFTTIHQSQANTMAEAIESAHPEFDTRKTFLGTYQKTVAPNGETIPEANEDIIEDFERGSLIINYTGHGSEKLWADERVLTDANIESLENVLYPFLVTATCEFGRNDDPADISSAELSVLREKGGSVGLVTTARPVVSNTNFALNQAFYDALFQKESGHHLTLGEIFRRTKNNSASGVGNRNFSLLGDPSLTLAIPDLSVAVTEIKTESGSDTLKALSTVVVRGEIQDAAGTRLTDFNGTLEATLFDKQADFVTIGKNNPPFSFQEWYNALFRGKASVKEGAFELHFIVPKNIAYEPGQGKLSLYASDASRFRDASGSSSDFKVGGTEDNPATDNASPVMQLYMGDTTFVHGGIVSANTTLVARIQDASGINISNYGIGNTMIAVLDNDDKVYILNEYYVADTDDFTKGWLYFPVKDLSPGKHTFTVKVWDTHNNPAQATIDFVVTGDGLVIETFGNFPNPFENETTLFFTHNRSGEDLQVQLSIFSVTGHRLKDYEFTVTSSPYQVNLLELNSLTEFGKKLPGGLYLARLAVRSLSDSSKNERVTKLIVLN